MVLTTSLVALSALAASVDAAVFRRHFVVPSTYDSPALEPYDHYHSRYLALQCYTKHNTTFFADCCHPMLKTEKLETARLPKCIPGSSDDDDEDCDDGDDQSQIPSGPANAANDPADSAPSSPAPTSAAPPPPPPPATTSEKPKATSSSKSKPPKTSSKKPAPTGILSGTLSSLFSAFNLVSDIHDGGIATWFTQNGNAGNCGKVHQDSDSVVALPTSTYANGAHCGKKVAIVDKKTGVSATGIVADSCPTCPDPNSMDLSTELFNKFAQASDGVFNLAWAFID